MNATNATAGLADLLDEKKRLDDLLDLALEQYALYEEGINAQMKGASPEEMQRLMQERSRFEETLGVVDLVAQIDVVRDRIAGLRGM